MDRRISLFSKSANQSRNFHGLNARAISLFIGQCLLLLFLIIGLTACQSSDESPTDASPGTQATQPSGGGETTGEDPVDVQEPTAAGEIEQAWQGSPHSDTYVEGDNNICARCHAPVAFVPSIDDISESCLVCKFEIAPPPASIAQDMWTNIECNVCHLVDKNDEVEPEFAWLLFLLINEYEQVDSSTELCGKCHADPDLDLPGHTAVVVGGAHADYSCTDCHDAHSTTPASCGAAGCHDDMAADIPGHDEAHEAVSCVACHDAGGKAVGPDDDLGAWITFLPPDSEGVSYPFSSHNTQLEANCDRCHYPNNTWGLSEDVN
ncbi:MAG: hypothetical protein KAR65_02175 [Anaerolineales bacterium]|nr:hypothetical protein [Anaerolineales bacterium]